jgi:glycosyltransferase involved in cell wall biosynthesis
MDKKSINVLFITPWYPSDENKSAGVFIQEHALAINQISDVNLLLYHTHVLRGSGILSVSRSLQEEKNGLRVRTLRIEGRLWKFVYFFPFVLEYFVKKDLRENAAFSEPVDVIHSNVIHPLGVIGSRLKKKLGAKVHIISEHWSRAHLYSKNFWFGRAARLAYSEANAVLPVSRFLSDSITKVVGPGLRINIVPNIVSPVFKFEPCEKNASIKFVCVSNWQSPKRPDLIFESLEMVSQQIKTPIELVVVGKGPLLVPYKSRKFQYKVSFHEYLNKEDLCNLFNRSSFMLLASDTETFSVITAEALNCGLPVLASNRGALPELVDTDSGILVENDLQSWVDGVLRITSHTWNRAEISSKHQPRFTQKKITEEFKTVYNLAFSVGH